MGLSTIQYRRKIKSYGAGSYLWMAPEALLEQPHTEKVDVYRFIDFRSSHPQISFAIVMWQMLDWNPDPFKKYLDLGDLDKLVEAIAKRGVFFSLLLPSSDFSGTPTYSFVGSPLAGENHRKIMASQLSE